MYISTHRKRSSQNITTVTLLFTDLHGNVKTHVKKYTNLLYFCNTRLALQSYIKLDDQRSQITCMYN